MMTMTKWSKLFRSSKYAHLRTIHFKSISTTKITVKVRSQICKMLVNTFGCRRRRWTEGGVRADDAKRGREVKEGKIHEAVNTPFGVCYLSFLRLGVTNKDTFFKSHK